ncbi:hypothetical protein FLK61_23215 [Paenalkalicoccus suaedae]|uniref:Uncharacterized protein n=1 Tax=Paenalkalicoccus suaedae TaxID=2592382 RepID=A0A859FAR4_9BACI|nr:hypothetical protein [Paenalkalicoccus suaedae]QKS69711.1 hypothetical protein FLK61_23215 [Paenalkalicoccus suaedae]
MNTNYMFAAPFLGGIGGFLGVQLWQLVSEGTMNVFPAVIAGVIIGFVIVFLIRLSAKGKEDATL